MEREPARPEAAGLQDEQSLLARCQNGDRDAYGKMVECYQLRVFNLVLRMVGSREAAQDLTQEAFIRGFQNMHRFELGRGFLPWMFRIAANLSRNFLRSPSRREFPLLAEGSLPDSLQRNPEQAVEDRDFVAQVERALLGLPEKYRIPLVLKHVEGLSYREMRDVLRLPLWVLKMRVCRARAKLREVLQGTKTGGRGA